MTPSRRERTRPAAEGAGAGIGAGSPSPDPDALSPVAQDYLKVIWSRTEWGDPPLTTGDLAARMDAAPATVTETVRRLAEQGLVAYTRYRPVELTDAGRAVAIAMVRRHRLIETYLVRALGYGWDEVHDEAERLEHAASPALIDRIDAALGHPTADPHGDPIPRADGTASLPDGAVLLDSLPAASAVEVLRVSDADAEVLAESARLGLVPGRTVHVSAVEPAALCSDASCPHGEGIGGTVPSTVRAAVRVRPLPGRVHG